MRWRRREARHERLISRVRAVERERAKALVAAAYQDAAAYVASHPFCREVDKMHDFCDCKKMAAKLHSRTTDDASRALELAIEDDGAVSDMRELRKLCEWLNNEAEELAKQAIARENYAKCDETTLLKEDERRTHRMAEQMMGRKIPRSTSAELRRDAHIQRKIADKCDMESKQLSRWSDLVLSLAKEAGK